ncbi:hypothetical protein KTR10_00865 [Candidatus Kaiserbacteria bacterium]|nr:hypothetical protein [Candidatus Kaiserbacteria bacterium]
MVCFLMGSFVHAQVSDIQTAYLEIEPTFPQPNSVITVTLNAYALNMSGASIFWFVDGTERESARDTYSTSFTLGEVGSVTDIAVQIQRPGDAPLVLRQEIRANSVDLVIEADTTTPPFYKGRALPAPDETIRAVAVTHTGAAVDSEIYTYTWRLGQKVLGGTGTRGGDVVTFTMPRRSTLLRVEVTDDSGIYVGGQSLELQPNNAEVYFYKKNPLRGLSQIALGENVVIPQGEMSLYAGVYNVGGDIFAQAPALSWSIDKTRTDNYTDRGQSITLQGEAGTSAQVDFSLRNTRSLTQFADGSFSIFFQ